MASPDGEIRISTKLDNSGINPGLRDMANKMKGLTKSFSEITAGISNMQSELKDVNQQYDELVSKKREPAELKKMSVELKTIQTEVKNADKAFQSQSKSVEKIVKDMESLGAKYEAITSGQKEPAELKALTAELKSVQKESEGVYSEIKRMLEAVDEETKRLEVLKRAGASEGAIAKQSDLIRTRIYEARQLQQEYAEIQKNATSLSDEIDKIRLNPETTQEAQLLKTQIDELSKSLEESVNVRVKFREELEKSEGKAKKLADEMEQIRLNPETSQEAKELQARMDTLGESIGKAASEANELRKKIDLQRGLISMQKATRAAMDLARKVAVIGAAAAKGLGMFASYAAQGAKNLGSIVAGLVGIRRNARPAARALGSLSTRLVRLAKNVFVFSVITSGLRAMREGLSALISTNTDMTASLNAIQVNLLTAFAPIWEVIQPALIIFLSILNQVVGALATFFAILSGKTYDQAKAAAEALYNQAKATKEAGKAADEAGKKLARFDDINQLVQDTAASGAGDGLDFEIEPPNLGWLDQLKDKFDSIQEAAYALGKKIAEAIANALASIDWDKVKNVARTIAATFAEFLNGFIDTPEFWYELGHTLAEGLNTAFVFLEEFADTLKWRELGEMIAYGLNTFIDFIDPEQAARAIYKFINGIFTTAYTALVETNWDELGRKIGVFLNDSITGIDWDLIGRTFAAAWNALTDTMYALVTEFNWANFGTQIGIAVNGWFNEVDWAKVGKTLSDGVIGVLSALNAFVRQVNWQEVGSSISEGISSIDFGGITASLWELIGGAIGALFSLVKGVFTGGSSGGVSLGLYIKENIIDAFATGFTGATSTVEDTIQRFGDDISADTRAIVDPILESFEEATRKLTELFVSGKPVVAADTAEIANYFKTMADTAINELERMRDSAIMNLAEIFGEEAVAYEESLQDTIKFYDDKIAELERYDKELNNAVRNAKIQYGEESEEYANAVREFEEFTSTKVSEIERLDRLRDEELQSIAENVDSELAEYARAREGLYDHYGEEIGIVKSNQNERNEALKNYLTDGEELTAYNYKKLRDLLEESNSDAIDAIVTNNAEQKSLKESARDNSLAIREEESKLVLAEAKRQRDEEVENANKKYDTLAADAKKHYDIMSEEDKAAVDARLAEAWRERNEEVSIANDKFNQIKDNYSVYYDDLEDEQRKGFGRVEKDFKSFWTDLADWFKDKWKGISDWFGGIWDSMTKKTSKSSMGAVAPAMSAAMSTITYGFEALDIPGFAKGLAYVPFDDFPALLHKGERVLTADENRVYSSIAPSTLAALNNFSINIPGVETIIERGRNQGSGGKVELGDKTISALAQEMTGEMLANMSGQDQDRQIVIKASAELGPLIRLLKAEIDNENHRVGGGFSSGTAFNI